MFGGERSDIRRGFPLLKNRALIASDEVDVGDTDSSVISWKVDLDDVDLDEGGGETEDDDIVSPPLPGPASPRPLAV